MVKSEEVPDQWLRTYGSEALYWGDGWLSLGKQSSTHALSLRKAAQHIDALQRKSKISKKE